MQLVEYLVSIESTLSSVEITELRGTPIFPRAGYPRTLVTHQPVNRHLASTLYAPIEAHIALGLPVIEWRVNIVQLLRETTTRKIVLEAALTHLSEKKKK
jgi:hypothetical protein